jgi:hypothetical protein
MKQASFADLAYEARMRRKCFTLFALWVANSQLSGDRGLKQAAAVLLPSMAIKRG